MFIQHELLDHVLIPYTKELVAELRKIFMTYGASLNDGLEKLAKKRQQVSHYGDVDRGPYFIEFTDIGQAFEEESSPRRLPLIPFIHEPSDASEVAVWLGFRARLDMSNSEAQVLLTSLSLSFVRGSHSQTCLFRAEWEPRAIENSLHAQPHWHAIPSNLTTSDPVEDRWGSIQSSVHLAMCARWRAQSDECSFSHAFPFGHVMDVYSWVRNVLEYGKAQLSDGVNNYPAASNRSLSSSFDSF